MIRVYNSLTKRKEDFTPLKEGEVRMYVCGPTVYDLSHIGHARSAVAFDVIYRYLKWKGYQVRYARNYTDIDDKIINRAREEGVPWEEIARRYIRAYDDDMRALGVEPPTYRPKATETIPQIIRFVEVLIEKGHAYTVEARDAEERGAKDVYYRVRSFPSYGKLSGKDIEELEAGARVEVDERKEDPLDFALWKASKKGEPSWESPWGRGRPGWHIECSAMSQSLLGETLDIHGGGKDLIFPHHENEIAQSEAATGKPFVRYWLHNGFVNINKEKMSKSLGNILTIRDVLRDYPAEAIRLFLLSSHYRSPIDYSPEALNEAEAALDRFYLTMERMERDWPDVVYKVVEDEELKAYLEPYTKVMDDDFNTAALIGLIYEKVNEANRLMDRASKEGADDEFKRVMPLMRRGFVELGRFLGLFYRSPEWYFEEKRKRISISEEEIEQMIRERDEARKRKDWKRADEIRAELFRKGIVLEDTPKGTVWRVK